MTESNLFSWGFRDESKILNRGKIIVVDGIDGSGKKTQTEILVERFLSEGRKVVRIDFPQYENNLFGKLLKQVLSDEKYNFLNVDPHIASVIYAADRWESKEKLDSYLKDGYIIILDRYVSSNQIHQGGKFPLTEEGQENRKKFMEWLSEMEHKVFKLPEPDVIFYLSLELDTVKRLMEERGSKEAHRVDVVDKNYEYQKNSRLSALKLAEEDPKVKIVSCDLNGSLRSIEDINNELYEEILKVIKQQ